jgi:hypothetical protein
MNSRIQNQLNMVGACITVANSTDYKPVWSGNAINAGGVSREVVTLPQCQRYAAHHPVFHALCYGLRSQIGFNEDLKDVTTILFLGNPVDARFQFREGIKVVKNSRTNELGCFVMLRRCHAERVSIHSAKKSLHHPFRNLCKSILNN